MEYEPGCEKYHFKESRRDRWDMFWHRFENNYGFAIGPMIFFVGTIIMVFLLFPRK